MTSSIVSMTNTYNPEIQKKLVLRKQEFEFVAEIYDLEIKRKFGDDAEIIISTARLSSAVNAIHDEINRYKDYNYELNLHKSKANFSKVYSYTTYWIMKFQPFFFVYYGELFDNAECRRELFRYEEEVNIRIMLNWLYYSLCIHCEKHGIPFNEYEFLTKSDIKYYIYNCKYRNLNKNFFEYFFESNLPKEVLE